MEQVVFVITECNPFHNGHRALFDEIRRRFPERGIVCVQSGNFVQRGEFASADKYARGAETVRGGADLVLELIPPYSCLSGEAFAAAAVHVAANVGLSGTLVFGSEVPDQNALWEIARRLSDPAFEEAVRARMEACRETGYPAVRASLYEERYGPCPALSQPNASLGICYLMALLREENAPDALPLPRVSGDLIACAGEIREMMRTGKGGVASRFMPVDEPARLYERFGLMDPLPAGDQLLYLLRALSREEIASRYGMAPLTDRAVSLAWECGDVREVISGLKAAHLTDSRVRRSLLALLLGTPKGIEKTLPPYTVVLAANEKGRALLAGIRKEKEGVRVITKPADAQKDPALKDAAERAAFADSLYAAAQKMPGAHFLREAPRML